MTAKKKILHFAAVTARVLHLWPLINKTGVFNNARRRQYPDSLVHLDVVITECCSLKCRDCSNFMQYYKTPENLDPEEVIGSLKVLFKAVRVHELKLLGGEPFVAPKVLIQVLEYLGREASDSYDEIKIISNGTIVPGADVISAMKKTPRLTVVLSNYGKLSSRSEEVIELCRSEGINCILNPEDEYWWDYGRPVKYEVPDSKTQAKYAGCYARRLCNSLYRGKLYVCPRQAHGIRLGMYPEADGEYVPLLGNASGEDELRKAVLGLADRKKFISACRYCIDRKLVKIPKAVQISELLDHE